MILSKSTQKGSMLGALSGVWPAAIAIFMPILAILISKLPQVALGNFTDAVFYLSYARQFSELVLRHGFLYYTTRFGGILPDALSGHLCGEITGIWVLRWALSVAVSLCLFLTFRKRYGVFAGLMASVLWSFNPAALRLACTTYVDSTSVPFLILGCCLVAMGGDGGLRGKAFAAGVLFGLASSAHLYAAFALILLVPWIIGACWGPWKNWTSSLTWSLAGFAVPWVVGWCWYAVVWGMPNLLGPTIDLMRDLGNGQAAQWKKPMAMALHETPAWFAPVLLLPICCMVAIKGSALMRGAACSLLLGAGFFWGGDLFGKAYVLSMPFYYSFLLPVVIVASPTLCGELLKSQASLKSSVLAAASLFLATAVPTVCAVHGCDELLIGYGGFAGVLIFLLWSWRTLSRRLLVMLSILSIGSSMWVTASTGIFRQMLGYYPSNDIPVLELADGLRKMIPSAWGDTKVTRFWYDDDRTSAGSTERRMIGSFWLHAFGKLTGVNQNYIPFPNMTAQDAEAINVSGVDRVVIFDQSREKIDEALKRLEEHQLPYELTKRCLIHAASAPDQMIEVAFLERKEPANQAMLTPLGFGDIHCGGHQRLKPLGDQVSLSMDSNKWWDRARLTLPSMKKGDRLHVKATITSGLVRFMLKDDGMQFEKYTDRWISRHPQDVTLMAPIDLPHPEFGLRSLYPHHSKSRLLLEKVAVEKAFPSSE